MSNVFITKETLETLKLKQSTVLEEGKENGKKAKESAREKRERLE